MGALPPGLRPPPEVFEGEKRTGTVRIVRLTGRDDMGAVHALVTRAFAGMEGRIDPPSSLTRMGPEDFAREAAEAELWALCDPDPVAVMVLRPRAEELYLGKLAVDPARQGAGLGRRLVEHAAARARALGLPRLVLQTRVELVENHTAFAAMGFRETGRTAHPGYDRPTSVTFARDV